MNATVLERVWDAYLLCSDFLLLFVLLLGPDLRIAC